MSINQGHDDPEIRRQFGSDSARLVYGRNPHDGRLIYISKALRGAACGLVCPHCEAPLIANLKDDLKAAHFAHHGPACGGGPETALHLLCKQTIQSELRLTIPRQFAAYGAYEVLIAEEQEVVIDRATLEFRDHVKVIPDLYLQVGDIELFVEIAVTHPCGEEKISRLKELGTAAIEIDMSSVPRNAPPDEVRQAVLSSANRIWLFNARIEREMEEMRLREQHDANAAAERLASVARRKIKTYNRTRQSAREQKLRIKDLAALRALGMREHLAIQIGGTGCFTVRPETWRSVVLATILRPRMYPHRFLATAHILSRLVEEEYVHNDFVKLTKDLSDAMRRLDPEFLTPWEAIHEFLKAMTKAGLTEQKHSSFALNAELARQWHEWQTAEGKRSERRDTISNLVLQILHRIPAKDRAAMTVDSWWQTTDAESTKFQEPTFDTDTSMDSDLEKLLSVLLRQSSEPPHSLHGLPAARAIKEAIALRSVEQAQIKAKREAEEADGRRQSLISRSEGILEEPDLGDFLRTPLADHGGILPLDLAEASSASLGLAEKALTDFAQFRDAERIATKWRSQLEKDAERLFGDRAARITRQSVDGKLDGRPPLIYCRNEATYRAALAVLHWIAHAL